MKSYFSLFIIAALFSIFYFGCQEVTPTDPTSELNKPGATWDVPGDFATIQDAIDDLNVIDGDIIRVSAGNHFGS